MQPGVSGMLPPPALLARLIAVTSDAPSQATAACAAAGMSTARPEARMTDPARAGMRRVVRITAPSRRGRLPARADPHKRCPVRAAATALSTTLVLREMAGSLDPRPGR